MLSWSWFCHSSEASRKTCSLKTLLVSLLARDAYVLYDQEPWASMAPALRRHLSHCQFLPRDWKTKAERGWFLPAVFLHLTSLDFSEQPIEVDKVVSSFSKNPRGLGSFSVNKHCLRFYWQAEMSHYSPLDRRESALYSS